ncbi:serine/threonine protein phosphatase, partial [Streptomyces sp. SID7804]|nr:serine/threonine protein phosphatase [Streptomyces sp. SID7804]
MDSTRVTEQPTSFERPQPGVDPVDPRGALLHTPPPAHVPDADAALPVQSRSGGESTAPGAASPGPSETTSPETVTPDGADHDAATGPEHSQPGAGQDAEPDAHRPRPA